MSDTCVIGKDDLVLRPVAGTCSGMTAFITEGGGCTPTIDYDDGAFYIGACEGENETPGFKFCPFCGKELEAADVIYPVTLGGTAPPEPLVVE